MRMHYPPKYRETPSGRFLSPLVRSMAVAEGLTPDELDSIDGRTGREDNKRRYTCLP